MRPPGEEVAEMKVAGQGWMQMKYQLHWVEKANDSHVFRKGDKWRWSELLALG